MTSTLLITGCSSGIGHDAAQTMAARGWRVFAACRTREDCARLRAEGLDSPLIDHEAPDTIASGLDAVLAATGGRLDAVFHNGAYAIPGPLEDVPPDAMRAIFEANFFGWHDLTRRALPALRTSGGRLVLNSSVLGLVGAPWRGAYVATKFALEGWADVLRMEMRGTGVDVVLIEPGPIDTPFRANAIRQFERWIDWERSPRAEQYRDGLLAMLYRGSGESRFTLPPSAVTAALIRALESKRPRARYRVTTPTRIMAIARRLLPSTAIDRIMMRA